MRKLFFLTILSALFAACAGPGQAPTVAPEESANEVASDFLEAYGAFDAEQAITYLADDADISGLIRSVSGERVQGNLDEFRLLISWLKAQGYKQILHTCEEQSSSGSLIIVKCAFDFHGIRSEELGHGPFSGSYFRLTIRDGKLVGVSKHWALDEFGTEMWEPFMDWMFTTHPEDADLMFAFETSAGPRLNEESIRLWELYSREYVEIAKK